MTQRAGLAVAHGARMIRASLLCALALSTTLLPACTDSQPADELGEETAADGEDGKGDAAGAFTFFNVLPDTRACSFNSPGDCGRGYFVSRANRSTTQCGRGLPQSQCKVLEIDWTGTAMPPSVAQGYQDSLDNGNPLLVRGTLAPAANDAGVSLAATEIWVASKPEWEEGVFTLVKDNGIRCITAPCPSLTERRVNSNLSANIASLDFEDSGADEEAVNRAYEQMYGADGLIVVGYRFYDSAGGKGRSVNKFFTRAPVPLR
jgi:hypothetical protein